MAVRSIGNMWPGIGGAGSKDGTGSKDGSVPVVQHKVHPSKIQNGKDLGQHYRNPPHASLTLNKPIEQLDDRALTEFLFDTVREHFGDYARRGVADQVESGAKRKQALEVGLRNIEAKLELLEGSPYAALRILLPVYHRLKSGNWSQAPVSHRDKRPEAGRHLLVPVHGDMTPSNLLLKTDSAGNVAVETHDYDEACSHGPRSIDLERGATAVYLAASSLEVPAGGKYATQAHWNALEARLAPAASAKKPTAEQKLDAELWSVLVEANAEAGSEAPIDPSGKDLADLDLSPELKDRLALHTAEIRQPVARKAAETFARAYQQGIQHFVDHPEATDFPVLEHLQANEPAYWQKMQPLFERSANLTLDRQINKWADPDQKVFKAKHYELESASEETEGWQAVVDGLKAQGHFPEDAVVHDVAHRMESGGGSLGIYKRYLLVETQEELQLWQAKEPTASSAEAHAPMNMVDLRSSGSRELSDLDDAKRSIDIKAMHHGKRPAHEFAVRFDGLDHILSLRDPTRVTFDAKRVASDQVEATAFILGIECARAHANGFKSDPVHQKHPKMPDAKLSRLQQGVQGDDFVQWLLDTAEKDTALIRRAHHLLRDQMPALGDAIFKHGSVPALQARVERRTTQLTEAKQLLAEARAEGVKKKKLKKLRKAVDKAQKKLDDAQRQLRDARKVGQSTQPGPVRA